MGATLFRCEQTHLNTVFVATMDRIDEPSQRMVQSLQNLRSLGGFSRGFAAADDDLRAGLLRVIREERGEAESLGRALFAVAGGTESLSDSTDAGINFLEKWALMNEETRFNTLLHQRLIERASQGSVCPSLMVRVRGSVFREEGVTELKEFLLSAMEVIMIYADVELQLKHLGPEERKMVHADTQSDQLTYWQLTGSPN